MMCDLSVHLHTDLTDRNRQKKSEDGHSRPINKYEENEVRRERFTRGALDSDRPRSRDIEKEIERETSWHRKAHDALSTFRDEELRKDMRGDLDIRGHRRQTVDGYEVKCPHLLFPVFELRCMNVL